MKLLLSKIAATLKLRRAGVESWLLRRASMATWLSVAVLLGVAMWGWVDPFGLRQRLDWMVADQFFRHRTPPPLSSDLLQVSIDDNSANELGFPVPRYLVARAIHQLQSVGARAVMVDVVYSEPKAELALAEADRLLVPRAAVVADDGLAAQFAEDHVLAEAIRNCDSIVLAYYLSVPYRRRAGDEPARQTLTRELLETPTASAAELASRRRIDPETAARLFDPALRAAFEQLAGDAIQANPELSSEQAVAEVFGDADVPAGYLNRFLRALDRARSASLLGDKGQLRLGIDKATFDRFEPHDEAQLPVFPLVAAADWLGFADAEVDHDGTLRRLPLVKRWHNRIVAHEALAATAAQFGVRLKDVRLETAGLRLHPNGAPVPLDTRGRLTINWPMNGRRPWDVVIPQIALVDLIELDRYDFSLRFARHKLREYVAQLDRIAPTGDLWDRQFESILTAYSAGDVAKATEREQKFDNEGIPRVLGQEPVKQALEQARLAAPQQSAGDPKLNQFAGGVVEMQSEIEAIERERSAARQELTKRVQGKLCLIGDTTTGSADLKKTPVGSDVPGVAVITSAVNTMLTGSYATVYGYPVSALFTLLLGAALFYPFFQLRPLPSGACASVACLGSLYASFGLLSAADTMLSPVTPLAGIVALYLTAATYQWLNEYRQRKLVRTIFEAQTNPTIVERLIEAGQAGVEEVLTPKNRLVTVFFAEIADYEALAQQVAPERLPEILARIFGTMNKIVQVHEGTLDRYQGHAMVAFFGAPVYQPDHAQRACRTALECCDTLRAFEATWTERGLPVPRVQIGLHTGELLVGNITLTSRVDYTVAGENLNVAYRIGELNETYGTQIMMSEATLARCENMVEARELDFVRIKGRREPVRAYELMTAKGRLSPDQMQLRGTFSTGLVAFRNKDYTSALASFRTCRDTVPGDRPATVYIERCEQELKQTLVEEGSESAVRTDLP